MSHYLYCRYIFNIPKKACTDTLKADLSWCNRRPGSYQVCERFVGSCIVQTNEFAAIMEDLSAELEAEGGWVA